MVMLIDSTHADWRYERISEQLAKKETETEVVAAISIRAN